MSAASAGREATTGGGGGVVTWIVVGREAASSTTTVTTGQPQRTFDIRVGDWVLDRRSGRRGRVIPGGPVHSSKEGTTTTTTTNKAVAENGDIESLDEKLPLTKRVKIGKDETKMLRLVMVDDNDDGPSFLRKSSCSARSLDEPTSDVRFVVSECRHLIPIYAERAQRRRSPSQNVNESKTTTTNPTKKQTTILVTDSTETYRLLATSQVVLDGKNGNTTNTNVVLEIGCSTGGTSEILWKQLLPVARSYWIGMDTGADMVRTVQQKLAKAVVVPTSTYSMSRNEPQESNAKTRLTCVQMNPLKDPETAIDTVKKHILNETASTPTEQGAIRMTVFVDIGGNREEAAVVRMIHWILSSSFHDAFTLHQSFHDAFTLHQIIVKSESVYAALQQETTAATVGHVDGRMDPHVWCTERLRVALRETLPKHPLQAAKRFRPVESKTATTTAANVPPPNICRYHNYHVSGCAKGSRCPYDHDHCHLCLTLGHTARQCPLILLPDR